MDYIIVPANNQFSVFKKGTDGKPFGRSLGTHTSEEKATKQIDIIGKMASGQKWWDDDFYYQPKIDPDDERAAYDPMGGRVGEKACANCFWFQPANASCGVIWGDIVATGLSNLWLSKEAPEPDEYANPVPVILVNSQGEPVGQSSAARKSRFLGQVFSMFKTFLGQETEEPVADSGFKVYADGRWIAWYSNSAKDRANEWFPGQATDMFIKRVDEGIVPYPELWFKHTPVRMGKSDFLARIGYMTFATGTFFEDSTGQKARAYYEAEQKAGKVHTMSHGFLYPQEMKMDGMY